ncbi:MAG TPA: hypothetical protein VKG25_11345 [Bryobacteraceae bacterium]|nr:hypothetical protein [Bryobacteraceae bacterium]
MNADTRYSRPGPGRSVTTRATQASAILAPLDDEPFTEEDRQAVAEADAWLKQNEPIPLENILADFGLTKTDWDTMAKTPLPEENGKGNAL